MTKHDWVKFYQNFAKEEVFRKRLSAEELEDGLPRPADDGQVGHGVDDAGHAHGETDPRQNLNQFKSYLPSGANTTKPTFL